MQQNPFKSAYDHIMKTITYKKTVKSVFTQPTPLPFNSPTLDISLQSLLVQCWDLNPSKRPAWKDILEHPALQNKL